MNKLIPLTTAMILALGAPQVASAQQDGRGNSGNHGGDHGARNDDHPGRGSVNRGNDRDDRGVARVRTVAKQNARDPEPRGRARQESDERRDYRNEDRAERLVEREVERRVLAPAAAQRVFLRREADRGLIAGCPPGLARKDNGCLPPGQARQIARARQDYSRYDSLWRSRDDGYNYRYDNGYVYRVSPQGSLLGYLPVLGGALSAGNPWPAQYAYQPAPSYLSTITGSAISPITATPTASCTAWIRRPRRSPRSPLC